MPNSQAYKFMSIRRLAKGALIVFLALLVHRETGFVQEPRKIRMAYFEGGKYPYHDRLKDEFLKQLDAILPDSIEAVFAPEGYRSAEWDKKKCEKMAGELAGVQTIDLVVAAGPWVVKDLLDAGFKKPIIGIHQFAPQFEGLLDKKGKPVASNLTIHYQKNKIESDLTALASLVKTKKLGFLYFPSGNEADSVLAKAQVVGAKLGFEIVTATGQNNKGTFAFYNAYGKLDKKIDALYIGPMWACDIQMINQFFYNTDHDRIPVMTSEDRFLVDRGALLTNNAFGIYAEARFNAYKTAQVILGKKPNKLPVEFSIRNTLAINEAAARKNHIPIEQSLFSEASVVPAPPDEDVTLVTLSYAIGRAVSFNPDDTTKLQAIEAAAAQAAELDSNLILSAPNESPSPQLQIEAAVTKAFLHYLKIEEVLKNHFRIRELIDRNVEVSRVRHQAEKTGDKDLKYWQAEREKSTQLIIKARYNLKVAQVLLNVLMNYPQEQKLSLEGDRFNAESTQKLFMRFVPMLSDETSKDSLKSGLMKISVGRDSIAGELYQNFVTRFENLAVTGRQLQLERIELDLAVSKYDAGEIGFDEMLENINQINDAQKNEINARYNFYGTMASICSMIGWSSYESGGSFVTRVEKLIIERE